MTERGAHKSDMLEGKRVLVTGGTGSLGKAFVKRVLGGRYGRPAKIIIFSRDEAKQYDMRLGYLNLDAATEEVIYEDSHTLLDFRIGDVRDYQSVASVLRRADVVINAAALKQVPSCEYAPSEAVATNISGAENIVRAIENLHLPVETVIGVSTDKACKPINVMGMTKAIQERIFITANLRCPTTRFICVRYGNVLASRGSVVPLFHSQIRDGGPITITTADMTRFLLSLNQAVDTILTAYRLGERGETFVPRVPSSLMTNVAAALINGRDIAIDIVGIRPGEKVHEVLVAEDEVYRTTKRDGYYVIHSILPELAGVARFAETALDQEFSSACNTMSLEDTRALLEKDGLTIEAAPDFSKLFG